MNPIFTYIVHNSPFAKQFILWYKSIYGDITKFKEASFIDQLGVYLHYIDSFLIIH